MRKPWRLPRKNNNNDTGTPTSPSNRSQHRNSKIPTPSSIRQKHKKFSPLKKKVEVEKSPLIQRDAGSSDARQPPEDEIREIGDKNNQDDQNDDQGIIVAIRMKPLTSEEEEKRTNRVWKMLPKYSSVTQTTRCGKPLPERERVVGKTFFTFDKIFSEDSSTEEIYDSAVKGIVSSAVAGINGTVFAYGQTSSGKTHTMQGAGTIEQGLSSYTGSGGGIIHMAARDIFERMQDTPDRVFLTRVSYIEIYREEVRDLLCERQKNLPIREDPKRGVFVQATEEIVQDVGTLLGVLVKGEKNRSIASTAMNDRSSRSHTIFRITIESRGDEENRDRSDQDGAVFVSTLNLVDLAGTEGVRYTGATGERRKEGALINQSLLALSRVIVALGSPNKPYINFRDSKLTRILQTSLSGNARMVVICCTAPSEIYMEETRSTLQFASRAKLVKTRAQVNEVLDDRSMIKRLQRELAEARRQNIQGGQHQDVKVLEEKATNAGLAAEEAKEECHRLQVSMLNCERFFREKEEPPVVFVTPSKKTKSDTTKIQRRNSFEPMSSPVPLTPAHLFVDLGSSSTNIFELPSPMSLPGSMKIGEPNEKLALSPSSELALVREALKAKALVVESNENLLKRSMQYSFHVDNDLSSLREEIEHTAVALEEKVAEKDLMCQEALVELERALADCEALRVTVENVRAEKETTQQKLDKSLVSISDRDKEKDALTAHIVSLNDEISSYRNEIDNLKHNLADKEFPHQNSIFTGNLHQRLDAAILETSRLKVEKLEAVATVQVEKEDLQRKLDAALAEIAESKAEKVKMQQDLDDAITEIAKHASENHKLKTSVDSGNDRIASLNSNILSLCDKLESAQSAFEEALFEKETEHKKVLAKLETTVADCEAMRVELVGLRAANQNFQQELPVALAVSPTPVDTGNEGENQTSMDALRKNVNDMKIEKDALIAEKNELITKNKAAEEKLEVIKTEFAHAKSSLSSEREAFAETIQALQRGESENSKNKELQENIQTLQAELATIKSEKEQLLQREAEYEEEKEQLRSMTDVMEEKKDTAMQWYESISKEYENVSAQTIAIENDLITTKEENEKLKLSNYELQRKVTETDCQIVEVSSELQCVQVELSAELKKADQLASLIMDRTKERDQAIDHCEATVSVLQGAEQAIQTLNMSIKAQESQESILWKDLQNAQAQNSMLDTKVKKLEAELRATKQKKENQTLKFETDAEKETMSEVSFASKEDEEAASVRSLSGLLNDSQFLMKVLSNYLDEAKPQHKATSEANLKTVKREDLASTEVDFLGQKRTDFDDRIKELSKKVFDEDQNVVPQQGVSSVKVDVNKNGELVMDDQIGNSDKHIDSDDSTSTRFDTEAEKVGALDGNQSIKNRTKKISFEEDRNVVQEGPVDSVQSSAEDNIADKCDQDRENQSTMADQKTPESASVVDKCDEDGENQITEADQKTTQREGPPLVQVDVVDGELNTEDRVKKVTFEIDRKDVENQSTMADQKTPESASVVDKCDEDGENQIAEADQKTTQREGPPLVQVDVVDGELNTEDRVKKVTFEIDRKDVLRKDPVDSFRQDSLSPDPESSQVDIVDKCGHNRDGQFTKADKKSIQQEDLPLVKVDVLDSDPSTEDRVKKVSFEIDQKVDSFSQDAKSPKADIVDKCDLKVDVLDGVLDMEDLIKKLDQRIDDVRSSPIYYDAMRR